MKNYILTIKNEKTGKVRTLNKQSDDMLGLFHLILFSKFKSNNRVIEQHETITCIVETNKI